VSGNVSYLQFSFDHREPGGKRRPSTDSLRGGPNPSLAVAWQGIDRNTSVWSSLAARLLSDIATQSRPRDGLMCSDMGTSEASVSVDDDRPFLFSTRHSSELTFRVSNPGIILKLSQNNNARKGFVQSVVAWLSSLRDNSDHDPAEPQTP